MRGYFVELLCFGWVWFSLCGVLCLWVLFDSALVLCWWIVIGVCLFEVVVFAFLIVVGILNSVATFLLFLFLLWGVSFVGCLVIWCGLNLLFVCLFVVGWFVGFVFTCFTCGLDLLDLCCFGFMVCIYLLSDLWLLCCMFVCECLFDWFRLGVLLVICLGGLLDGLFVLMLGLYIGVDCVWVIKRLFWFDLMMSYLFGLGWMVGFVVGLFG